MAQRDEIVRPPLPGGSEELIIRGKLNEDLYSGSGEASDQSAMMSIWDGDPLADTGDDMAIYDSHDLPFITVDKMVPEGTPVTAQLVSGKYYLLTIAGCEEDQGYGI